MNILDNNNFRYCIQFLRNADERLRAVVLVRNLTGLSLPESMAFVDGLKDKIELPTNRKQARECYTCKQSVKLEDLISANLTLNICPGCKGQLGPITYQY